MARRRLPDEPNSKLAVWSRRFALFSVAAALIAIIIVRAGLLEVLPGMVTFGGALAFGAIRHSAGAVLLRSRSGGRA